MNRIKILALVLMLFGSNGYSEIEKILNIQQAGGDRDLYIPVKNDTDETILNPKISLDCGCVKLLEVPAAIPAGVSRDVHVSVNSLIPQRKENHMIVTAGAGFKKQITIVNYFTSSTPQIFGNSIFKLWDFRNESTVKLVLLGDDKLSSIKLENLQELPIVYSFSESYEIPNSHGSFRRVLDLKFNGDKLLSLGFKMLRIKVKADDVLSVVSE